MPWYYANNNQRLGPVSDSEFARLVREKIIHDDSLVWRHGMPDWKRYAEIAPTLPPPGFSAKVVEAAPVQDGDVLFTPVPVVTRLNYAGFWVRAAAKLIDWLILFLIGRQIAGLMGLAEIDPFQLLQGGMTALEPYAQRIMMLALVDSTMRLAFYWFFLKRFAATPGKMLLGLKVVSSDGSPLSHGQVVGRFFAEVVSKYFTLCLGYAVAGMDEEKRTMHDHFCNTRVVKKHRE